MPNIIAQRIIGFIQETFLDVLLVRLLPLLWYFQGFGRDVLAPNYYDVAIMGYVGIVVVVLFAWVLGFTAIHRGLDIL